VSWREVTLGEVIKLQRGHDLPDRVRAHGTVPVVSSSGITGRHNVAKVGPPGVVTGRYGTIGEVFYLDEPYWPLNTALYVVDFKGNDPRFVAYLLRNTFKNYRSEKAAVPGVDRNVLHLLNVRVPDNTFEQQRVVSTLSAYDELIENNLRRIGLLEEAARLLYREWFVHFRFPGHQHIKTIHGSPEGWEHFALSELAEFVNGYPFKPSQLGDAGLPIVKIPELNNGVTKKTPRNLGEFIPERYQLKDSDLLFSWSGTLAVNVWACGPALLNQHLFHVMSKGRVGNGFLMFALREALGVFANQTVGATMKHIRRSALDDVYVAIPEPGLFSVVDEPLNAIYAQLVVLQRQIQQLAAARDLLLPRVMSGEIAV
jgi:type I restriction enzyme S subunit